MKVLVVKSDCKVEWSYHLDPICLPALAVFGLILWVLYLITNNEDYIVGVGATAVVIVICSAVLIVYRVIYCIVKHKF